MAKPKVMKTVRIVLICLFATIFIVSSFMLVNTLIDYHAASKLYDQVRDDFMDAINKTTGDPEGNTVIDIWTRGPEPGTSVSDTTAVVPDTTKPDEHTDVPPPPVTTSPDQTTPEKPEPPEPEYSEKFLNAQKFIGELKKTNPDVIGYIQVTIDPGDEDKNISYPMVKGKDDSYYIDHGYDNSSLRAGAIFLDYRCSSNMEDNRVSVIYGHNMNNGAMFHNLKYLKQEKYLKAAVINVYTTDAIYTYKPFSVYNTSADSNYAYMFFNSDEQYLAFIDQISKDSLIVPDMDFYANDRILTLSTCLNTSLNARLAVHAVLVGISH